MGRLSLKVTVSTTEKKAEENRQHKAGPQFGHIEDIAAEEVANTGHQFGEKWL